MTEIKGFCTAVTWNPGTSSGCQIQYPIGDFEQSWAIDGRVYLPVWK